jgi:hypothetical protein
MQPVNLEVTIERPMAGAQAQLLDSIEPRMRSVHFSRRAFGDTVTYRPKFMGLSKIWVICHLSNQHVTFVFEQEGPTTQVRVTGRLRPRVHAEVTDALGGS